MKILGISCSKRKLGNTDILVHHALKGASHEGAEIKFLRLTDLEIKQCSGCYACMAKGIDCIQDDQFLELVSDVRWADGVILGVPTYILNAPGSVIDLTSRFFRFYYTRELENKLGLALSAAGGPDWGNIAQPQGSLWFLFSGMRIIDRIVGYGQGPGEVLFDENACQRTFESGAAMARGETEFRGNPGVCPDCHFDLVATNPDGSAHCVLCDIQGKWVKKGEALCFKPDPDEKSRFSREEVIKHFKEDILTSVGRFISRKNEIKERLKNFQMDYSITISKKGES